MRKIRKANFIQKNWKINTKSHSKFQEMGKEAGKKATF